MIVVVVIILILGFVVYRYLAKGMDVTGKTNMKIPVAIYAIVISLMLYTAISTFFLDTWSFDQALLVAIGAILFYLSDILNAISRFVDIFPLHRLWIMSTYHLAQMCITIGATLHFTMM